MIGSHLKRLVFLTLALLLVACSSTGGSPDYRDEVGANGLFTPRAIFARYTDALGGESVLRSHESRTQTGIFDMVAFGVAGDMVMKTAAPNYVMQNIELDGLGTINSGYNGEVGWSVNPLQGTQELTGRILEDTLRQAEYYMPMTYANVYPQQETMQLTDVNGEQAYEVKLTDINGGETMAYFSADTDLMIRVSTTTATPVGNVPTTTDILSYQEFDGEQVPVTMSVDQGGQQFTVRIDSVTFNDVDDDDFAPPAGL